MQNITKYCICIAIINNYIFPNLQTFNVFVIIIMYHFVSAILKKVGNYN